MARSKLQKFAEVEIFANVITTSVVNKNPVEIDEKWPMDFFPKKQDVTLELGCGKGDYTISLARKYPDRNFIGIDIKTDRLWFGAKTAIDENLKNVAFVKLQIEHIPYFFPENFVSEAWIPFPDPHANKMNGKRRLTSDRFLNIYRKLLKDDGSIHFKTDDDELYHFSKESIESNSAKIVKATDNLYESSYAADEHLVIKTTYEKRYLAESKTIKYIHFSF